ncbi:hypothetical protein [Lewinella sp. 4G2]|uniref:hypothetical protein n=1 Tax=Lewinella sp. 4G2 TaxID=1803372 RepID=UPI0012FAF33C|nr:hypothetical protein [Lewinella sp. 4G2]
MDKKSIVRKVANGLLDEGTINLVVDDGILTDNDYRDLIDLLPLDSTVAIPPARSPKRLKGFLEGRLFARSPISESANHVEHGAVSHYASSRFRLEGGALGLPASVEAHIVAPNGKFSRNLSSISVQFDYQAFLSGWQEKYKEILRKRKDIPALDAPSLQQSEVLIKEARYQLMQRIVNSQVYNDKLVNANKKLQRIQNDVTGNIDSIREAGGALVTSMREEQNQLQAIANSYRNEWEARKNYYGDQLTAATTAVKDQKNKLDQVTNPENVQEAILRNRSLSFGTRLLAASKKLQFGRSSLNGNWYVAESLPMNGLAYGLEVGPVSLEVAYGRRALNSFISPLVGNQILNTVSNRDIVFLKGGYEIKDRTRFEVTYLRSKRVGTSTADAFQPSLNNVASVSQETKIGKLISLNGQVAVSANDWTGNNQIEVGGPENLAGEVGGKIALFKENITVGAGFFYVGDNYLTVGNPFLQTNQKGITVQVDGNLGNKLAISAELRSGTSLKKTRAPKTVQRQIIGRVNYRPIKSLYLSAQVSPNFVNQYSTTAFGKTENKNFVYAGQYNYRTDFRGTSLILNGGVTNFTSESNFNENNWQSQGFTVYQLATVVWPSAVSLTYNLTQTTYNTPGTTGAASETGARQVSSIHRLSTGLSKSKVRISIGLETLTDPFFAEGRLYGTSNTLGISLTPKISCDANMTYQHSLSGSKSSDRYMGTLRIIKRL